MSRGWILFALARLAVNLYAGTRATQPASRVRVPCSPFFLQQVTAGHVKEITSKGTAVQGTFTQKELYAGSKPTTLFRTEIPAFADNNALSRLLQQKRVTVNAQPLDTGASWWQNLLLGFGPTVLFVLLLFWLMRRAGNVQNVLGSFGRSRARRYQPSGDRVTFADLAGIDEAKAEPTEVVDFLRHPDKYQKLGRRIPHGVLLYDAPGTGKTLARAVAGEAEVPFFSMAASEFVEAIVGVGASHVRDLFTHPVYVVPNKEHLAMGLGTGIENADTIHVPLTRRHSLALALRATLPDELAGVREDGQQAGVAATALYSNSCTVNSARRMLFTIQRIPLSRALTFLPHGRSDRKGR